ncbi:MAG: BsuBI/PstI family type II restriction endonuclease [Microcoleaceae cyanobacterium]
MPDIVVYYSQVNWLVLIEAVTSHGPINPKRYNELQVLFQGATVGLVFVTAFLTRKDLAKHLSEIAWKTEVWVG